MGTRTEASLATEILGSPVCPGSGPHPLGRALSYLKREPLISYNGRLGPIDDLGEGQLPARAEKHRDAASLGGRDVTAEPGPTLCTLMPPPSYFESQQLLLLGVRNKEERKVVLFFWGGVGWSGVVLQRVRRMLP